MENASKALIIAGAILISILLISIGIILINSGRDVTETGKTGMQSQAMQAFNAQFLPYEGIINGTQLKALYETVQASNAAHPENYVRFSWPIDQIKPNLKYRVKLYYTENDSVWRRWRRKRKKT